MSTQNLIIAFGGVSPEHEVSVITAIQAAMALEKKKYHLVPLYVSKSGRFLTGAHLLDLESYKNLNTLEQEATPCTFSFNAYGAPVLLETKPTGFFSKPKEHAIDAVLVAFHGSDGENGHFQGLCEQYNIPYTGSGAAASAVGMDKYMAKQFARSLHIPVADDVFILETEWISHKKELLSRIAKLGKTVFIKPVHLGSSIGVTKAETKEEIETAIETGFRFDDQLIAEKAISPLTEVNCSVLGDYNEAKASVCEQPIGKDEALTFEDKYMGDSGKGMASASRIIPAPISEELTQQIQATSVKLFKLLNAGGVARFDFLVNQEKSTFFFNEINTIPGSFSFYLWEKSGMPFNTLLESMIGLAYKKHRIKNGRVRSFETNLLSEKAVKGIKGLKGKG